MQRRDNKNKQEMPKKKKITHFLIMGDSLSDRGTLNKRKLFGFIPMSIITFFASKTHNNRFTNQYTWDDDFGAVLEAEMITRELKDEARKLRHQDSHAVLHKLLPQDELSADLSDDILDHSPQHHPKIFHDDEENVLIGDDILHQPGAHDKADDAIELDNDALIPYKSDDDYIRTFCEGGLTSHDWRKDPSHGVSQYASRHMLSTLEQKRAAVVADDIKRGITDAQKANTLVIEWSGANDLITVNDVSEDGETNKQTADKAIAARIENIRKMHEAGYREFVIMALPDLSIVPRFAKQPKLAGPAGKLTTYFNDKLRAEIAKLQLEDAHVQTYDVNKTLHKVIANPKKYGFTNISDQFVDSEQYKKHKHDTPLKSYGYMFWDIHPTGHTASLLTKVLYDDLAKQYKFERPKVAIDAKSLYQRFKTRYFDIYKQEQKGLAGFLFGGFRNYRMFDELLEMEKTYPANNDHNCEILLAKVLKHATQHGGKRSIKILQELMWVTKKGHINHSIPALKKAQGIIPQLEDLEQLQKTVNKYGSF